ncbi:MAG TPA: TetR/AcrR family transcriptional regulator [Solirubrobacteraceae bacterium]
MAAERAQIRDRKPVAAGGNSRVARARGVQQGRSIMGLQRARLLSAAVALLAEDGNAGFSAAAVCGRAGVSRRTFYELFDDRQQCFAAILAEMERRVASVIAGLGLEGLAWGERVRMGLWAILCLVDSDPGLAKVCLVESQRAGGLVQLERERIVAALVDVLDEGRSQGAGGSAASRLTAEALIGAISSVIAARLTGSRQEPAGDGEIGMGVRGLLGELAGMIVLPYQGPAAARRQIKRALPTAPVVAMAVTATAGDCDPLAQLPMRLTYRTARALKAVAELTETGAGASNRQIAEHAGVSDGGQASKLLCRLQERNLIENTAVGGVARGEANQWHLTALGARLVQSISFQDGVAHLARRSAA